MKNFFARFIKNKRINYANELFLKLWQINEFGNNLKSGSKYDIPNLGLTWFRFDFGCKNPGCFFYDIHWFVSFDNVSISMVGDQLRFGDGDRTPLMYDSGYSVTIDNNIRIDDQQKKQDLAKKISDAIDSYYQEALINEEAKKLADKKAKELVDKKVKEFSVN